MRTPEGVNCRNTSKIPGSMLRGAHRTRGSLSLMSARAKASSEEGEFTPAAREGSASMSTPASAAHGPKVWRVRALEVAIARRTP